MHCCFSSANSFRLKGGNSRLSCFAYMSQRLRSFLAIPVINVAGSAINLINDLKIGPTHCHSGQQSYFPLSYFLRHRGIIFPSSGTPTCTPTTLLAHSRNGKLSRCQFDRVETWLYANSVLYTARLTQAYTSYKLQRVRYIQLFEYHHLNIVKSHLIQSSSLTINVLCPATWRLSMPCLRFMFHAWLCARYTFSSYYYCIIIIYYVVTSSQFWSDKMPQSVCWYIRPPFVASQKGLRGLLQRCSSNLMPKW